MCREAIEREVARFRAAMDEVHADLGDFFQTFPRGCCGDVAELLAAHLKDAGLGTFAYVSGRREGGSHAWLERDGLIADATPDQFEDGLRRPLVTTDSTWHDSFSDRNPIIEDGDFRVLCGEENLIRLESAYDQLRKFMDQLQK
ncbi:hypothetical protein P2H44_07570 [Albimonas sp. CAU 1670]|uniref:hypothetical protein n=1 Tax=Albimonas sp. CAU 1670 TaxID=3032599 RepID=UPI0023DA8F9B|nr:hypothetical protein [Albimonas sp. CAU 1670]MDF2232411.1 hypothetical protein [Albimonas sp. CAU 1670]